MKRALIALFLIFLSFSLFHAAMAQAPPAQPAQPAPLPKPSPDNPQPPLPQPAPQPPPDNPPAPQQQPAPPPTPAPDSRSQPQQAPRPSRQPVPDPPPLLRGGKYRAPWEGEERWGRFSRVGIGTDISPLGIGFKGATILTNTIDLRFMGNILSLTTPTFDVEGTKATGTIHLTSLQTAVDFYPRNSIWRFSAGALLLNGNQLKASGDEQPGQSFTLNGDTYYSSEKDPVKASGILGLHTSEPALTASFGFGRYVPHSSRRWSFPTEFGVVFMGTPTLNIAVSGTVCTGPMAPAADCSDVGSTSNPIGAQFNQSLQTAEARWRRSLGRVTLYPIFSYGVMYSFTIRDK